MIGLQQIIICGQIISAGCRALQQTQRTKLTFSVPSLTPSVSPSVGRTTATLSDAKVGHVRYEGSRSGSSWAWSVESSRCGIPTTVRSVCCDATSDDRLRSAPVTLDDELTHTGCSGQVVTCLRQRERNYTLPHHRQRHGLVKSQLVPLNQHGARLGRGGRQCR